MLRKQGAETSDAAQTETEATEPEAPEETV